ncbi:MAG TPA: dienelactone hydrolase family protein [Acidimicrobiales bacterium]|nr:dienelactone hydrolase family protein [Acidimicrobiales bacterium]
MGEIIGFPSNGGSAQGYLAGSGGPAIVVIQEWWGLVDHIKSVCDRFADEGFVALAPDLYRGQVTTEPDDAAKAMMGMQLDEAARDMGGAVDELRRRTGRDAVGVIGFCMGGGLALVLATLRPDAVKAVVPCYGVIPWAEAQPDYSKLEGAVGGHYAELDESAPPTAVRALETQLRDLGKEVTMTVHPGTRHAFFNDTRPEVYDSAAAEELWTSVLGFFRAKL